MGCFSDNYPVSQLECENKLGSRLNLSVQEELPEDIYQFYAGIDTSNKTESDKILDLCISGYF